MTGLVFANSRVFGCRSDLSDPAKQELASNGSNCWCIHGQAVLATSTSPCGSELGQSKSATGSLGRTRSSLPRPKQVPATFC